MFRSILQSPSYYAEIQRRLQEPGNLPNKLVDVPTLMWLIKEYETEPAYKELRKSYAAAETVCVTPGKSEGLRRQAAGDGVAVVQEIDGVQCWSAKGSGTSYFIYFGADESFSKSIGEAGVVVKVTYLGQHPGKMVMEYDSRDVDAPVRGAYKVASAVGMSGSGERETVVFELPDARFSARQNGSGDFRIAAGGKPLMVSRVEVVRK